MMCVCHQRPGSAASVASQPAPSALEARQRRVGPQPAGRESDVGRAVVQKPSTATRGAHEARAAARGWRVASARFGSFLLGARRHSDRLLRPAGNAFCSSGSARPHLSAAPGTPARLMVPKRLLMRKFAELVRCRHGFLPTCKQSIFRTGREMDASKASLPLL